MSLMNPSSYLPKTNNPIYRWFFIGSWGATLFLLNLRFGSMPDAGLDASWTEVLAWAMLKHLHWGRDIVFTYGPLGFLHGGTTYFPGMLVPYVIGQIILSISLVVTTAIMLRHSRLATFLLFAAVYTASFPWMSLDVFAPMILLFGTSTLIDTNAARASSKYSMICMVALAMLSGAVTLIKFSLFPLWILCVTALTANELVKGTPRRAISVFVVFLLALLFDWLCCRQNLGDFPSYLYTSFEIASGYGHTMGMGAPPLVEIAGGVCMFVFAALCLFAAYQRRGDTSVLVTLALYAAAALLAWRANFTRADHAPWFFAYFSLLPFAMLAHRPLAEIKSLRIGLILLVLANTAPALYGADVAVTRWLQAWAEIRNHYVALSSLSDIQQQRTSEWLVVQKRYELPEIKQRVGNATVDMFTVEQGIILLNELNYTPRPVFQSYFAYTPYLARLNETWLLGAKAPVFIVMHLEALDGRLPMGEDPLALIALLQHYRPVLMEQGFLLLQRDGGAAATLAVGTPEEWTTVKLGEAVPISAQSTDLNIAFVKAELTPLGQLYTWLLREPPLRIKITTLDGEYDYRFLRPTGATGFVVSPLINSTEAWDALQQNVLIGKVSSFRITTEARWQEIFFQSDFQIGFETREYLHTSAEVGSRDMRATTYPGFNVIPKEVQRLSDLIVEDGKSALFIHAPGKLHFEPLSMHYRVSAEFGIQQAAIANPACSGADGIGVSLVRLRASTESQLLHRELDPFHVPFDGGAHRFEVGDVSIEKGDQIEYRVDPGHAGNNTICDWSYIRNLEFDPITASDRVERK